MSYTKISNFGPNASKSILNNPITYCLKNNSYDNKFLHGNNGTEYGAESKECQMYMSDYCSKKWDNVCEYASTNNTMNMPNNIERKSNPNAESLTLGEILIYNTARKKYMKKTCNKKKCMPFDYTVADSPMICYDVCNESSIEYELNSETIDEDPVMNKILSNPKIAINLLVQIYMDMKRNNTLVTLENTKVGHFFKSNSFQIYLKQTKPMNYSMNYSIN